MYAVDRILYNKTINNLITYVERKINTKEICILQKSQYPLHTRNLAAKVPKICRARFKYYELPHFEIKN